MGGSREFPTDSVAFPSEAGSRVIIGDEDGQEEVMEGLPREEKV